MKWIKYQISFLSLHGPKSLLTASLQNLPQKKATKTRLWHFQLEIQFLHIPPPHSTHPIPPQNKRNGRDVAPVLLGQWPSSHAANLTTQLLPMRHQGPKRQRLQCPTGVFGFCCGCSCGCSFCCCSSNPWRKSGWFHANSWMPFMCFLCFSWWLCAPKWRENPGAKVRSRYICIWQNIEYNPYISVAFS